MHLISNNKKRKIEYRKISDGYIEYSLNENRKKVAILLPQCTRLRRISSYDTSPCTKDFSALNFLITWFNFDLNE